MNLIKHLSSIGRIFLLIGTIYLWGISPQHAAAEDFSGWHFYADTTVLPQADDAFDAVYADFSRLFARDLKQQGEALDENSIRVAPVENGAPGVPVPFRFVKDNGYNATDNAAGTIIFLVASTPEAKAATYRVFFDTQKNGPKTPWKNPIEVPEASNLIWNGGFEILSQGYTGPNPMANAGANLPHGWWGNLKNAKILENAATSAHSGQHAIGFVVPEGKTNISVSSAPSPPGIRIVPGQTYQFSFWVKGENLTSAYPIYGYVYWYGKDQKQLSRTVIGNIPAGKNNFDWTPGEVMMTAPADAHYTCAVIGTYSTTGLLMVDDFAARILVPAPLADAKSSQ